MELVGPFRADGCRSRLVWADLIRFICFIWTVEALNLTEVSALLNVYRSISVC